MDGLDHFFAILFVAIVSMTSLVTGGAGKAKIQKITISSRSLLSG